MEVSDRPGTKGNPPLSSCDSIPMNHSCVKMQLRVACSPKNPDGPNPMGNACTFKSFYWNITHLPKRAHLLIIQLDEFS
jgi:hypothetical protein